MAVVKPNIRKCSQIQCFLPEGERERGREGERWREGEEHRERETERERDRER